MEDAPSHDQAPRAPRRYLEEPAYLGRDFPTEDGYPPRRRFHWVGPLVLFPLAATILEFGAGNTVAGVVCLAIFAACATLAYRAVRRQIQAEAETRHPRQYP
jgi:hypothetical protein